MAARVTQETPLPIKCIAAGLQMGTAKSLKPMLLHRLQAHENANDTAQCAQLQFQPPVDPFQRGEKEVLISPGSQALRKDGTASFFAMEVKWLLRHGYKQAGNKLIKM
jgi:hypothetical protein